MSFRPQIRPLPVITNGDMTKALTSLVTIVEKLTVFSYAYSWAGTTPVGSISVQFSNDYALNADGRTVQNPGTWDTVYFWSAGAYTNSLAVSGSPGVGFLDILLTGAYAARTLYTPVSGSGLLQATFCGKVS